MRRIEKIINILLLLTLCFFSPVFLEAASLNDIKSDKLILYNLDEGTVLYEKKSDEKASIASLTKVMTVLVALDNIDDINKNVVITHDMIKDITWDVSVAGFKVGDKVTYEDLLYGAILPSGADAVNALAISTTGSLKDFVKLMNDKAKSLGLKNTNFENVTGLDSKNHYSTSRDAATIVMEAIKNPIFLKVYTTPSYVATNGLKMKNALARYNDTYKDIKIIKGLKTGYTTNAQLCMSSIAEINGVNYLLVTLNAPSKEKKPYHISDSLEIYNYYSENYSNREIISKTMVVYEASAEYTKEEKVSIYSNETLYKYLSNKIDLDSIEYKFTSKNKINYKTKPNTKIGTIKIYLDDELLGEVDGIIKEKLNFSLSKYLKSNIYFIIILTIIIYLTYRAIKVKIRRQKRRASR